jgi:hypothetical protein
MTALEALQRYGPQTSLLLLTLLDMPPEQMYSELVAAEASGEAQINVIHERGRRWCEWEAT